MSAMRGPVGEPKGRWSLLDEGGGLPEWMTSPTFVVDCAMMLVCIIVPAVFSMGRSRSGSWSLPKIAVVRTDCIGVDDALRASLSDQMRMQRTGDFSPVEVGERKAVAWWLLERPGQPIRLCQRR